MILNWLYSTREARKKWYLIFHNYSNVSFFILDLYTLTWWKKYCGGGENLSMKAINLCSWELFAENKLLFLAKNGRGHEGYGFIAIFKEFSINTLKIFSLSFRLHSKPSFSSQGIISRCHRVSIIVKLWRRRLLSRRPIERNDLYIFGI